MSAPFTIFRAAGLAARREFGTFRALKVNNFFLLIALFVYSAAQSGVEPKSAEFFILLLGVFLLFPLSSDPLALIPPSRLESWPLTTGDRGWLRMSSLLLSPVLWIAVVTLLVTGRYRVSVIWLLMAVTVRLVKYPGSHLNWYPMRWIPQVPGRLGGLIRHDLREMLSVLDPYVAGVLCFGGALYLGFGKRTDDQAPVILALVIGIVLSTYAQCLFGLDISGSALTRYRLLPLSGWQILAAKDIAYLCVFVPLILPFSWIAGVAFALVSLAIGHHPSVMIRTPIFRWRFAGSRVFPGVVQAVASIAVGFAAARDGSVCLVGAFALYFISLLMYGRLLEHGQPLEISSIPVENRLR